MTGKQVKMDVVVTENLFRGRKISKIFDLKGSVRNRHVKSTGNNAEVLLDENLVQCMFFAVCVWANPLTLNSHQ